jgi:hypothetical protein
LIGDMKPDALAIAGPTEAPVEENSADRSAGDELPRHDQSNPVSAKPAPSKEAGSNVHDMVDSESAKVVEAADPAVSDIVVTPAHNAAKLEPSAKAASRKQRNRDKRAETIVVVSQVPQAFHTAPDDAMSLDQEIKVLRGQLASKLQLQNEQLKKMLERFDG